MGKCINLSHPEFKNLAETSGLDPLILASKIKTYWEKTNNTDIFPKLEDLGLNTIKPGVSELFESNPELANSVYEALGFEVNITQDNKSYYRGQLKPFKIDKNGNLILEPKYAGWQEEISYDKHKGMGISMSPDLSVANAQGNMFYEGNVNRPQDEGWMDERDAEDWTTKAQNEGYYVLQVDKAYITENFKDIFDNENYEQRIGTTEPIIIPKGKFKIENITPDVDTQITSQQKQQAQQLYSQYLNTIFPDSKVKDVVYHGTNRIFDKFLAPNRRFSDWSTELQKMVSEDSKGAIYFTNRLDLAQNSGKNIKASRVVSSLLNIKNPKETTTQVGIDDLIPKLKKEGFDSYLFTNNKANYIVQAVFEPEQIHILGSKQDIEGFKEFVSKNNQEGIFLQKKSSQTKADDIDKSLFNVLKHYNISTNGFMSPAIWADKLRQDLKKAGFDSDRVRIKQTENKSYFVTVNKGDKWKFFKPGDFFFYQIKESKLRKERNKELDIAMQKFFETFGFQYESVSQIEFNGEVLDNIALSNTLTKVVQVIEGKATIDTLPEEAAHIFVELMGEEHPMVKRMLEIAPTLPIFEEVYNDYYDIYNGDQLKLAKETVGKVIAQYIVGAYTGDPVTEQTAKTWWQAIWAWITNRFRPNNPFKQAASEILNTALRQIPKEQVEPVNMEETTKEVKPSFTKMDYTGNNMSELKGANDEIFYNFEQYFPNYSYLTTAERIAFVELVNDGKIQISCKI